MKKRKFCIFLIINVEHLQNITTTMNENLKMRRIIIGGISCNIYETIDDKVKKSEEDVEVSVLFFLHGRFGHQEDSSSINAINIISQSINKYIVSNESCQELKIITIDQRNHGNRLIDISKNKAWKDNFGLNHSIPGLNQYNPDQDDQFDNINHAFDMYSIYHSTSNDISTLINYLPTFLFPNDDKIIKNYYIAGVSLGGHATWLTAAHGIITSFFTFQL
jgi:pimeloyl-ACP methyl ester carboxylesterase